MHTTKNSEKLIQIFFKVSVFRTLSQAYFWKAHPMFLEITIFRLWPRPIHGKLIHIWLTTEVMWMSFPRIDLAHERKIEIAKTLDEFPGNRFDSPPQKLNLLDEFSKSK